MLKDVGLAVTRAAHPARVEVASQIVPEALDGEQQTPGDVLDLAAYRAGLLPHPQPEDTAFLTWFLVTNTREVASVLSIHPEQVQRIRSRILDIDRDEVEAARIALGYTEADWRLARLTTELLNERVRAAMKPAA